MTVEYTRVSVDNKKYTVVIGSDGSLTALRYGEPWQDVTGNKFIYCLAAELDAARKTIAATKATTYASEEPADLRFSWMDFQQLSDEPAIEEATRNFLDDPTEDNSTCMVRAICEAAAERLVALAASQAPVPAHAVPPGYALIHEDALRAWGKLDEVRAACVYPVAAPAAQAPASEDQHSLDECNADVFERGESVCMLAVPKEQAEAAVKIASALTGDKYDWHYFGGRVHVKRLAAPAPAPAPDVPLADGFDSWWARYRTRIILNPCGFARMVWVGSARYNRSQNHADAKAPAEVPEIGEATWQQAADAIENLDDYARMMVGVDPSGPRETLYRFLEQAKVALANVQPKHTAEVCAICGEGKALLMRHCDHCGSDYAGSAEMRANAQAPAPAPEPAPWVPYLTDRADGVAGHYAIARWNPAGYREVWNLRNHRWASASDDVLCLEEADSLLRQIVIPTVKPVPVAQAFTEGHCAEKRKPGGCQLHNLHCGYPACDRKAAVQAPAVQDGKEQP